MTDHGFDRSDWIERLAAAVEDWGPLMEFSGDIGHMGRMLSYSEFLTLLNTANYQLAEADSHRFWSFINVNQDSIPTETRALVISDPNELANLTEFESLSMSLRKDPDLIGILSLLREHPIVHKTLENAEGSEGIRIAVPRGEFLLDLKTLARNLVELTIKTDGKNAAKSLDCFLHLGERRELQGYAVTLFYGLKLHERVNIGEGTFIAPYEVANQVYGLPKRLTEMLERSSLPNKGESITVLVREFKWGTGTPSSPRAGHDLDWNIDYRFSGDSEIVLDILSVAIQGPLAARADYFGVGRWLEEIDRNFAFGHIGGGGHPYDGWWTEKQLSDEDEAVFQDMIRGSQEYQGKRNVLNRAIRRLATSYNRPGMQGAEDSILDYATTLEILYDPGSTEVTYRLATRAAYFLGSNAKERKEIFDNVRAFYGVRSSLVHGREVGNDKFWKAVENGRDLARRTLLKLLSAKRPPDWDKLVMTGNGI